MRLATTGSATRGGSLPSRRSGALAFAGAVRRAASVVAVDRRHTRRVVLLRRVLPATGVLLLLLIAMWPRLVPLWERMRVGFPAIDLRDARELRMINPRYTGIDREGRPFVVIAASARQIPDRQDLVSLQAPVAEIALRSGAQVRASAISAVYQSQASVIDLFGEVTVTHQDGTRFVTQTARVDAAQNAAEGDDPVAGHGPAGAIKAQGFRLINKGETIIFTGRAEMTLKSAGRIAATRAPPSVPEPVAELAAQVESEAMPAPPVSRRAVTRRPAAKAAARPRSQPGRPARRQR
ncbi:MAG: LPS export ABC transporter periplasmic protein LptC [Alphaproteobacteria bacterium]